MREQTTAYWLGVQAARNGHLAKADILLLRALTGPSAAVSSAAGAASAAR